MLYLQNGALRVEILDPVADAARLGPRFCWGAYIWQVREVESGPLLTGPEWPAKEPTPFNGQGLPESFRHRTLEGRPLTWRGDIGIAVGAGEMHGDPASRDLVVAKPCSWQITAFANRLVFVTEHITAGCAYELVRTIEVSGRDLRSTSKLTNRAEARLTLEWFAHPFFPLRDGMRRAQLPAASRLAENPGFALRDGVLEQQRAFLRQDDGHMDRVQLPPGEPLRATVPHPTIGEIEFETSFVPSLCVIWGNDRTFSIEPYLSLDLAPDESREWSVSYRFGPR
jgi:hypothetical protein